MMNEKELKDFLEQEERKMNIGSLKLYNTHAEIMELIEMARNSNKVEEK